MISRIGLFLLAVGFSLAAAPAELVAYYSFDTDFSDGSGKGNDLVVSGGTPEITQVAEQVKVGAGALSLNQSGAEEHLAFGEAISVGSSDSWSVVWWGKRSSSALGSQGMIAGTTANSVNFIWTPDNPSVVRGLRVRNGSGTSTDFGGIADDQAFHHWAVVYDGVGTVMVWRDNANLGSQSFPGDLLMTHVGAGTGSINNSFFGQIDELRIYDEAITAAKVDELFSGAATPGPGEVRRIEVILLGGQSNAVGRASPSGLPTSPVNLREPQADVDFYEAGSLTTLRPRSQIGPEITLGRRLSDELGRDPATRVAIIKYGRGGTDLSSDWRAGGDGTTVQDGPKYRTFQNVVKNGLSALASAYPDAVLAPGGMVWVQGERDAKTNQAASYQTNLTAFIDDIRLTYGSDLTFVISRLSDGQTNIDGGDLAAVRAAQNAVAAADPNSALLDTDGFGMQGDKLHFDARGQQDLGNGAALEILNFHPFLASPTLSRQGDGGFRVVLGEAFEGFVYTLQANPTLKATGWVEAGTVTATGDQVVFPFLPETDEDALFFRIGRSKP